MCAKGAAIVAMCIEGKQISSDELAQFLAQRAGSGAGDVAFVIGSSHGLSDEVKKGRCPQVQHGAHHHAPSAGTAGAHRADLPRLHHQCGHEVPQVKSVILAPGTSANAPGALFTEKRKNCRKSDFWLFFWNRFYYTDNMERSAVKYSKKYRMEEP